MLLRFVLLAILPALIISLPVAAQERAYEPAAAVAAGTLGIGPEIAFRFTEKLRARANATFFRVVEDIRVDDISYDRDIRLRSGGAMLDVHPFSGRFRVSAGARINGKGGNIGAAPGGPVTVGDRTVTPAQVGRLLGKVHLKKYVPALTVGYGGTMASALTYGIEAGALFQGAPRIRNFRSVGGSLSADPGFASDLENERIRIENDLDEYRPYPVVQFSFGYRF